MKQLMARKEEMCQEAIGGAIRRHNVVKDLHNRKIQAFQDGLALMIGEKECDGNKQSKDSMEKTMEEALRMEYKGALARLEAAKEMFDQDQLEKKSKEEEHKTRPKEQKMCQEAIGDEKELECE
uniref:Oberon_cc domain-containing protein n=1 Tax=Caenorhabditis tropicalis TaxID=1561998 RepID=A0A1I7URV3_9PELO